MLLQALNQYAREGRLLGDLPFQRRTVHLLLPLRADGTLRGDGPVLLTTPVAKGNKTRDDLGQVVWLPRFPGENNGGKAYYLAENYAISFGLRKDTGESLPFEPQVRQDRNPVRAFYHFWQRIEEAFARTKDERLQTLLKFRHRYLDGRSDFARGLPFLGLHKLPKAEVPVLCVRTDAGVWQPIKKVNVVEFEVNGQRLDLSSQAQPSNKDDPIWTDWAVAYAREAFAEPEEDTGESKEARPSLCLVTGNVGQPVARSHKPKILGVPGLASGGYVVSFAKEAPAFSSYGFEMGENAPVSEQAAASYALALNNLLESDDTSFTVGDVAFVFWAEKRNKPVALTWRNVSTANPKALADFLKSPFAGIDRELARKEQFLSIALSANAGRVVIREWIRVTVEQAVLHLKQWFEDLSIVSLAGDDDSGENKAGPYSLFRLAAAIVRESKELKRVSEAVASLYRAALQYLPLPVGLLEPVLSEFRSALVGDSPKKPRYPFNQSRFALIKLILLRNAKEGGFMPALQLCETDDPAYNLGRLLCILAGLQDQAHEYKLEGPGIVERYYGAASSAPANVFAILWKLHNHHLRKLEQQGDKGQRAAYAIRGRIAEILARFSCSEPSQPPRFPQQLSLEKQGRFALGFYQQLAADRQASRKDKN